MRPSNPTALEGPMKLLQLTRVPILLVVVGLVSHRVFGYRLGAFQVP